MLNITQTTSTLQTYFGPTANQVARQVGLVKRERTLTGSVLLSMLVAGFLSQTQASYRSLAEFAFDLGVTVTRQAICERLSPLAVEFMQQMLWHSLQLLRSFHAVPSAVLNQFKGVYLVDSTQFELPATWHQVYQATNDKPEQAKAALKLQVVYNLSEQRLAGVEGLSAREPDQNWQGYLAYVKKASLLIFDLGYVGVEKLAALVKAEIYFLCRFNPQTSLYEADSGPKINLLEWLQSLTAEVNARPVQVGRVKRQRFSARLVAYRLPEAVVQHRRDQALSRAKALGRQAPTQSLVWLEWGLYLTSTTTAQLDPALVGPLYRLRWQIELLFKRWKSQAGVALVNGRSLERIWCELYAKLIGIVVFEYLSGPLSYVESEIEGKVLVQELSYCKAYETYAGGGRELGQALGPGSADSTKLSKWVAWLYERWTKFSWKEGTGQRPSSLQTLDQTATALRLQAGQAEPAGPPSKAVTAQLEGLEGGTGQSSGLAQSV
jgi:hypothetical protein